VKAILALLFLAVPIGALQPSPAMLRQLFEEALARRREQYGDSDVRTAQAARDLGLFLSRQGEASDARGALAEAVRIDEQAVGPAAAQTLADVEALALVSDVRQAEPLWKRAATSPDAALAARALSALGQMREKAGDLPRAASYYRQALAKEERSGGRDSPRIAVRLNALARVVDLTEGISLLERALEINRRRLGARHQETATIELNLAGVLLNAGRNNEAAKLSSDATATYEQVLGADSPRTAVAAAIQGSALQAKGDHAGAERLYRRALAIDEQAYGPRHPQTLADARTLATFLREIGKSREAAELEKRLLSGPR